MRNNFSPENVAVIILAAGMGTRMKSDKAKVLHEILGRPMIRYVVETAKKIAGDNVVLVIGNQAEKVRDAVSEDHQVMFAFQEKQMGTGHAVLCALPHVPPNIEDVLILCGDVPLITADTLEGLITDHIKADRDISLLAVQIDDPSGYGRVLLDGDMNLAGIVEEADATPEQKKIRTINTGIYCVKKEFLADALPKIRPDNAQGEIYLTDIIELGYKGKQAVGVKISEDADEATGINTPRDLAAVETIMRNRSGKIS
jgi:UDP-N-acetylglucosamine diphosphorylase/glucosamine-1-phosphate N-acetyltransferase